MKFQVHQSDDAGLMLLGAGQTADGKSTKRFVKDLISVGTYTHPLKDWTLEVTPDRLNKWATRFNAGRAAGIDFEVTVDHSQKADGVIGYLTGMFVEGDKLMGVHEFADDDAVKIAERCKNVSVEIVPDFTDSKKNNYGEMIVKSSLVQQPVVPGQAPFQKMAASLAGEPDAEPKHLWLSTTLQGSNDMDYSKISAALGETVTDEASLIAAINKMKGEKKEPDKGPPADPAMLSRIAALEATNHKLARGGIVANANALVKSLEGVVPAAQLATAGPAFVAAIAGTDTEPSKMCLSMTEGEPAPASKLLSAFGDLVKGIKPAVEVGTKTGEQSTPPADDAATEANKSVMLSAQRAGLVLAK